MFTTAHDNITMFTTAHDNITMFTTAQQETMLKVELEIRLEDKCKVIYDALTPELGTAAAHRLPWRPSLLSQYRFHRLTETKQIAHIAIYQIP